MEKYVHVCKNSREITENCNAIATKHHFKVKGKVFYIQLKKGYFYWHKYKKSIPGPVAITYISIS